MLKGLILHDDTSTNDSFTCCCWYLCTLNQVIHMNAGLWLVMEYFWIVVILRMYVSRWLKYLILCCFSLSFNMFAHRTQWLWIVSSISCSSGFLTYFPWSPPSQLYLRKAEHPPSIFSDVITLKKITNPQFK